MNLSNIKIICLSVETGVENKLQISTYFKLQYKATYIDFAPYLKYSLCSLELLFYWSNNILKMKVMP